MLPPTLMIALSYRALRFVLVPSLHPDWTLLLFFLHTHSTVTATLALIFIPKVRSFPYCIRWALRPLVKNAVTLTPHTLSNQEE